MKHNNNIVAWKPQLGTQLNAILASWIPELFYGGARGGGKTDYLLGDYAQDIHIHGSNWKGIIFRKTYPELGHLIERSKQIYPILGGRWMAGEKTWIFPNGATLKMRQMEREEDADKYQGNEYTWIGFDELPNWGDGKAYNKLKACLRSPYNVDRKRIRATGNPGGRGHDWVKHRFISPARDGLEIIDEVQYINKLTGVCIHANEMGQVTENELISQGFTKINNQRMFIPSRLQDNKILMETDPNYIARLAQCGSKELVRAWLAGDWDAIEGAFFDTFNHAKHVVGDFDIPNDWYRFRSFDWGFAKPFSCHWYAVSDGCPFESYNKQYVFPKGALICYREFYGTTGKPNEGVRMDNADIARKIKELEQYEKINDHVADPSIFASEGGVSIAEQMLREGVYWRPADNKRIAGWQQVRYRLNKNLLFMQQSCKNMIRTIPIMQHDERHFEDLDTKLEDHAVDELRYGCMSRPLTFVIANSADSQQDNCLKWNYNR